MDYFSASCAPIQLDPSAFLQNSRFALEGGRGCVATGRMPLVDPKADMAATYFDEALDENL